MFVTFWVYIQSVSCHASSLSSSDWLSCHTEPDSVTWSRSETQPELWLIRYFNFTLKFQITVCLWLRRPVAIPHLNGCTSVHPPQPEVNPVIQIHHMYPNPVSFSTSARTDDVQNWIMTLPPAGPATSLCGPTPGRNSSLWVKWEKLNVFITQALGSVNSPQAALQCCPQIKLHLNVSWHLHFKQSLWLFFFKFLHRWLKITQKTLEEGTRSWERHSNKTQGVRVGVCARSCFCQLTLHVLTQ